MPQSLHALGAHIVFSTKGRSPFLVEDKRKRMHNYMAEILLNLRCMDVIMGGIEDHVHIYCNLTKTTAPATVVQIVKQDSSKFAKTIGIPTFSWQSGYGLFAVGRSEIAAVQKYVLTQEAHHRTESFEDEYRRLLTEEGLMFDERYLWD